jgi:hypothetical protein
VAAGLGIGWRRPAPVTVETVHRMREIARAGSGPAPRATAAGLGLTVVTGGSGPAVTVVAETPGLAENVTRIAYGEELHPGPVAMPGRRPEDAGRAAWAIGQCKPTL